MLFLGNVLSGAGLPMPRVATRRRLIIGPFVPALPATVRIISYIIVLLSHNVDLIISRVFNISLGNGKKGYLVLHCFCKGKDAHKRAADAKLSGNMTNNLAEIILVVSHRLSHEVLYESSVISLTCALLEHVLYLHNFYIYSKSSQEE